MKSATNSNPGEIDLSALEDDIDRVLAALYTSSLGEAVHWESSLSISKKLLTKHGVSVHWRTIDRLMGENHDLAQRRKRSKRWEYSLLAAGRHRLIAASSKIRLIKPENAVEEVLHLHELLGNLVGEIRVCDPYLSAKTLEQLDSSPQSSPIQLLTLNVRDSGKLRALASAFQTRGQVLQIRVSAAPDIHDRYVIDDDSMFILGTSLNGFSKKQSFIVRAGEDVRSLVLGEFVKKWKKGSPWP